jgi:flagellar protein FliO/FliZ
MKFRFRPAGSLVLGLLIGLMAGPILAQSLPRLLENIKVSEVNGQETVRFNFSESYEGVPLEDHGPGRMSLSFSGTGSATPVRSFRVPESKVFEDIRVVQNKYSTTVSFTLKQSNASLKGRLGFERDKNILRMSVLPAAVPAVPVAAKIAPEENLLSQMSKTITGAPAPSGQQMPGKPLAAAETPQQRLGQYEGVGWLGTITMLGISLAAIVAGLYVVLYLYRRVFGARLPGSVAGYPIKMLSSFHIGPKQRVVVLEINGEVVACGVTASQISLITRLGGAGQAQRRPTGGRPSKPAGETRPAASAASSAGAAARPAAQSRSTKPDPVQQFAEALKDKVGTMKRIK